jgi:hypothetical protein
VNRRLSVKCDLGRFYQSDLFESIVQYFELFHGQVSIHFDNYPFHSNTSGRSSRYVDHMCSAFELLRGQRYVDVVTFPFSSRLKLGLFHTVCITEDDLCADPPFV